MPGSAGQTLHRLLARTDCGATAFAQILPLFFRQLLVFMPALVQFVMLFRGQLFQLFVALARLCALLGQNSVLQIKITYFFYLCS